MNIHQRLSLIGPLSPRGKPIGDAGAGSEEPDQVKETHKTFLLFTLTCQDSLLLLLSSLFADTIPIISPKCWTHADSILAAGDNVVLYWHCAL